MKAGTVILTKQCSVCYCWYNGTFSSRMCEYCKKDRADAKQERIERYAERYADEMPDNDVRFGESPDY